MALQSRANSIKRIWIHVEQCRKQARFYPSRHATAINTSYPVALSKAASPAAARYFQLYMYVICALCEGKNDIHTQEKVPLRMTTCGHRVSGLLLTNATHRPRAGHQRNRAVEGEG